MAIRPGWYMVCYDISHPRRLGKVHRLLKNRGISVQKSIFFIQRTERDMNLLLDELGKLIRKKEDDIRAYPVESPEKVWTTGGILKSYPLVMPGKKTAKKKKGKKSQGLWQRFFGRRK